MSDYMVNTGQDQLDAEAKEADFFETLKDRLYEGLKLMFWDALEEEPHDLKAAEAFILEQTGVTADIKDSLLSFFDGEIECNKKQIAGFICDLMDNTMSQTSAREMATIFSEYYIEFGDEILKFYKAKDHG